MADVDAALMQKVFDLPQRQRIADIHHHRQANYLRRRVETAEGIWHRPKLRNGIAKLKRICSDNADDVAIVISKQSHYPISIGSV
jgi:hypothetical protein